MESPGDITQFIGRFHLVLLHLPVGLLLLLGFLELLSLRVQWHQATAANRYILVVAAPVAVMTAGSGWLLAGVGGYDERLLFLHRWTGVGTAAMACVLLLVHSRGWLSLYRPLIFATAGLALVAGHWGGSLTHGKGYLTRHAPGWLGGSSKPEPVGQGHAAGFASIEPLLSEHCGGCHGPAKSKGGLRTDSLEALLAGGHSGSAIVPGEAGESLLLSRMRLPLLDDDHMPPEGKPQPGTEDIARIQSWIQAGAVE
jgi:hypothetical protein